MRATWSGGAMTPCRITTAAMTPAKRSMRRGWLSCGPGFPPTDRCSIWAAATGCPSHGRWLRPGDQVTGVDISDVQGEEARRLVPGGTFIRADATAMEFPP